MSTDPSSTLVIRLEHEFTDEMAAVRQSGWASPVSGAAGDAYDCASRHLTIRVEGRAVALVRITPGGSILDDWSRGGAPLPRGAGVAELTRSVVITSWRRVGLYRLAMLETMLRLRRRLHVTTATAAVEPEFCGRHFLARLGFEPVGDPVRFDDHPRQGTLAQCLQLPLTVALEERWHELRAHEVTGLASRGYLVESDLDATDGAASPGLHSAVAR